MNSNLKSLFTVLSFVFVLVFRLQAGPVQEVWSFSSFGDNHFFYKPSDIECDLVQSRIYIADSGNNRVVVFDSEGKLLKIIGRKGQGPAEFMNPTGLYILEDSKLAVADSNNSRVQIFDKSFNLTDSIKIKQTNTKVADLVFLNDKIYAVSTFGYSGYNLDYTSGKNIQPLVNVIDKKGNKIQSIMGKDFPDSHPFLRAIKNRVSIALSPEEKIYLAYFAENFIQIFDTKGNKIDEFNRPLPFKPAAPKIITQRKDKKGRIGMRANFDFVTRDIGFGPDNNLYLLTYTQSNVKRRKELAQKKELPSPSMRIEIIDPDSYKVLEHISCDPGTKAFSVMEDHRLVYIYEDSEGKITLKCVNW